MAVRSETRSEIAAGIDDVYRYVSDLSRWPEWAAAIRECRLSGDAPLQAGSRLEQRVKGMFGSTRDRALDVTAVDTPSRLAFTGMMGPSPLRWGFDLEPLESGRTGVLLWVEVERRGFTRAIPEGLLTNMIRRVNDREVSAIKAAVESTRAVGQAGTARST
jgi:hypothetical protein